MKRLIWLLCVLCLGAVTLPLAGCDSGGGSGSARSSSVDAVASSSSGGIDGSELNLAITSLRVVTENPVISYPLTLEIGVTSDAELADGIGEDINVLLFAVEKKADPDAQTREIPLGTAIISGVVPGGGPYEATINIPASVELPGDYYIVAMVDAADIQLETDEEDNTFSAEVSLAAPAEPNIFVADLTLDRASLEISTLDFNEAVNALAGDVYNADASATLTVGSDGLKVDETLDIEAYAKLRMMRSDSGTRHDVPLYLWNSTEQRYINAYGIDPMTMTTTAVEWLPLGTFAPQLVTPGSEADGVITPDGVTLEDVGRNSTMMSYYFPGKLGSELALAMRYNCRRTNGPTLAGSWGSAPPTLPPPDLSQEAIDALKAFLDGYPKSPDCNVAHNEALAMAATDFAICVEIRPANGALADTQLEDNERCSPLAISLPPLEPSIQLATNRSTGKHHFSQASPPLKNGVGFNTRGGGSTFAFGVDFGNYNTADYRGYIETISASIPITIFDRTPIKTSFDFVSIHMRAQLVPDYRGKAEADANTISLEIRHVGQMLTSWVAVPPGEEDSIFSGIEVEIDSITDEYSFSKEYPDPDKKRVLEATIFVGPVPMSTGAFVAGSFGVRLPRIKFTSANDDYYLGGTITPFANAEATMYGGFGSRKLVIAGVEGQLTLFDEELEFAYGVAIRFLEDSTNTVLDDFTITQGPKITNTFIGPQGRINLFAEFPVLKFKTCKVGFIKIRCPAFVRVKVKKNIFTSPAAFKFVDVLYQKSDMALDVVLVDGEDPRYFVPAPGEERAK